MEVKHNKRGTWRVMWHHAHMKGKTARRRTVVIPESRERQVSGDRYRYKGPVVTIVLLPVVKVQIGAVNGVCLVFWGVPSLTWKSMVVPPILIENPLAHGAAVQQHTESQTTDTSTVTQLFPEVLLYYVLVSVVGKTGFVS